MPEIVFKKDQFREFRATKEIALGGIRPQTGYRTSVGELIEFDGFRLRIQSGESIEAPHLRSAINAGWFVPNEGYDEQEPAPTPTMEVAPPARIPVVRYEDQIVASRTGNKFQATESGPATRILSQLSQLFPTAAAPAAPTPEPVPQADPPGTRRKFALTRQEEFEGEGIPIGSLRPKVQEIPKAVGAEGVFEDQRSVTSINASIQTRANISLEESAQVHKGSTDSVIMGKTAVVGTNRDSTPQQVRKMTMRTEDEGTPVARLRTPTSFGATQISATTSVDSAIAQVQRQAKVVPGTVEHAQAWAPPVEAAARPMPNAEDRVLTFLRWAVPGFSWDKNRPMSVRVAEAQGIQDPMMRRALLAYESEDVVTRLQKHWGV